MTFVKEYEWDVASFSLVFLRCSHQAKKRGCRFCSRGLFLDWHREQDQLGDIGQRSMPPAWRVSGHFPVQEPLIRAEIEEDELWGPEDGFSRVWMTNGLNMSAILMQLHVIPGKGDGLMFHLERADH